MTDLRISEREGEAKREERRPKLGLKYGAAKQGDGARRADTAA